MIEALCTELGELEAKLETGDWEKLLTYLVLNLRNFEQLTIIVINYEIVKHTGL